MIRGGRVLLTVGAMCVRPPWEVVPSLGLLETSWSALFPIPCSELLLFRCTLPWFVVTMSDLYAVVSITSTSVVSCPSYSCSFCRQSGLANALCFLLVEVEILLPEPIIPSWDLVYQALPGSSSKGGPEESFTGASYLKGTTTKVTDQEWTNRVNLPISSKSSLKRMVVFKIFRQSSITSKRRALLETSFPVSELVKSQLKDIVVREVVDSKGGIVTVKLTCEVLSSAIWESAMRKAKSARYPDDSGLVDSFLSDLNALLSQSSYRDKFVSYLTHKKENATELFAFFEAYMTSLKAAADDLTPAPKSSNKSGSYESSKKPSKLSKKAQAALELIEQQKEKIGIIIDSLLKESHIRKILLEANYLEKVIAWSCDSKQSMLATMALSSLKPMFASDPLQESLGRAGIIHFLIHILNPKTEYGAHASAELTARAAQILPYFSNRFHGVFVKADIFTCIENLLSPASPALFQRGVELLLIMAATKTEEVLKRFLPVFEKSLAHFAAEMKSTAQKMESIEDQTPQASLEGKLVDLEMLLTKSREAISLSVVNLAFTPSCDLRKPTIPEPSSMVGLVSLIPPPPPPAPPSTRGGVTKDTYTPPPPHPVKLPARERNATEIDQLSRQVGRLLEDPNADPAEVARILVQIETLGTDEPEHEASQTPQPAPQLNAPAPIMIHANVGLDLDELLAGHSPVTHSSTSSYQPASSDGTSTPIDPEAIDTSHFSGVSSSFQRLSSTEAALSNDKIPIAGSHKRLSVSSSPPLSTPTLMPPPSASTPTTTRSSSIGSSTDSTTSAVSAPQDIDTLLAALTSTEELRKLNILLDELEPPPQSPTSSRSDSLDLSLSDEEHPKPSSPSTSSAPKDKLRRSMNRLTQEIGNLELVANRISSDLTSSISSALDVINDASQHAQQQQQQQSHAPAVDGSTTPTDSIEATSSASPTTAIVTYESRVATTAREYMPPMRRHSEERIPIRMKAGEAPQLAETSPAASPRSNTSGLSQENTESVESSGYGLPAHPLPARVRRAYSGPINNVLNELAGDVNPAPPPPPPPAAVAPIRVLPVPTPIVNVNVNAGDRANVTSSSISPPPSAKLLKIADERMIKLRERMVELERAAVAPLQPILRLSAGHEEQYLKSTILSSLLTVMTHCTSTRLKVEILELVGKLSQGRAESLMNSGYLDALLSLATSVCSQRPPSMKTPLPKHISLCIDLLKQPNIKPSVKNLQSVAKLMKIPLQWFTSLHETILAAINAWDMYSIGPQLPALIHGAATLIDSIGNWKSPMGAIRKSLTPPDGSNQLPKDHLLLLSRLLRDTTFFSKWMGTVTLSTSETTLLPLLNLILDQQTKLTRSEMAAYDERVSASLNGENGVPPNSYPSKATKEPSSSGVSSSPSSSTTDSDQEESFSMAQLLEGALNIWTGNVPSSISRPNLGLLLLKLISTSTYSESGSKEKLALYELLKKVPYLDDMLVRDPPLLLSALQSDTNPKSFMMIVDILTHASPTFIRNLCKHNFGSAFLSRLDMVRSNLPFSAIEHDILPLINRLCLEGDLWRCLASSSQLNSVLLFLSSVPRISLSILRLLPPDVTEYLPVSFFDTILAQVKSHIYKPEVVPEVLRLVTSLPLFWKYVAVFGSNAQDLLIRIYFGESEQQADFHKTPKEVRDFARQLLTWDHCIHLASNGFLIRAFRLLSEGAAETFKHFLDLLVEVDSAQGYRLLRTAVTFPPPVDSQKIPASAAAYVGGALAHAGVAASSSTWRDVTPAAGRHMDWAQIPSGAPLAVVAFEGDTPTFGGILPSMPRIFANKPVDPPTAYAHQLNAGSFRIVHPQLRLFYKDSISKPTISTAVSMLLDNDSIEFPDTFRFNFNPAVPCWYRARPYIYDVVKALPPDLSTTGITRVSLYTSLPSGISTITAALSIAIERKDLTLTETLSSILEKIAASNAEGAGVADTTVCDLAAQFSGTSFEPISAALTRRICAPGYAVSTDWEPVIGHTTFPSADHDISIKASGCFAAYSETRGEAQVAMWKYTGANDPLAIESSSSEYSSSAPGSSDVDAPAPVSPCFTHFLLSITRQEKAHGAPEGVVVFMSENPLPVEDILKVPCRSALLARKAKWPVPPVSVVDFTQSPSNNVYSLVVKSPLVTLPMALRSNNILVLGFADKVSQLHPVIYSMILLGVSHTGIGKPLTPKFEYLIQFFKKASVATACRILPNSDLQGIIYYIGSELGTKPWANPHDTRRVNVRLSHALFRPTTMSIGSVVGREEKPTYWGTKLPVWFEVDLIDHQACPTHFALRHGYEQNNSFIQNWEVQGSKDGTNWMSVFECKPVTHTKSFETVLYGLKQPCPDFFRYWRVITHSNYWLSATATGNPMMCCSGFDLFGYLSAPIPQSSSDDSKSSNNH